MSSKTGLKDQADDPGDGDLTTPPLAPALACGDDFNVDPRRSLAITDRALLTGFTFERVMQQIVDTSGAPGLTKEDLYGRWWDFFNESPGEFPEARHCDGFQLGGQPALGAFAIQCPRPEGALASTDPFDAPDQNPDSYVPIGLFNRLDQAPIDGAHCGEYRIVFAKRSGMDNSIDRNLLIFEAVLPNPNPKCGVEGCQGVAEFWLNLSDTDDPAELRTRLEDFYFGELSGVGPVVHADNYGPRGGQIRTNGFMPSPNIWQLHEFKFNHDCGFGACIKPHAVAANPNPDLFADPPVSEAGEVFQRWFLKQVPNLEVNNVNTFFTTDVGTFNAGQSTAEGTFDIYRQQVGFGTFRQNIEAAITTGISADQLLNRVGTLSCAGCHQHNNNFEDADLGAGLDWQPSLGFVQITEEFTENGPLGPRFPLSDGVVNVFLPHRKQAMENFLSTAACSECENPGLLGTQPLDPQAFAPDGPSAPGLTLGGPPRSH